MVEDYEALKCRYPSKKCWNQRAVKRNGERHNLCEMHRQKANNNQRRLDKKRKAGHMKGSSSPMMAGGEKDVSEYEHHDKRMRIRLTDMYSQPPLDLHQQQQQQQQLLREREMAAVLVQTRQLQLPPLASPFVHHTHSPLLSSTLKTSSSLLKPPTILLPPITSVPRPPSEYAARCNTHYDPPAPHSSHRSWSFRYGSEEKIN